MIFDSIKRKFHKETFNNLIQKNILKLFLASSYTELFYLVFISSKQKVEKIIFGPKFPENRIE